METPRANEFAGTPGFRRDQEIETPKSLPTANVTAAARLPSNSIRVPENTAARPVNSDSVAPTTNSAIAVNSPAIGSARAPAPNANGNSGTAAPSANESRDEIAAPQGDLIFEELPLRAHRDEFAGGHRERAGGQSRHPGEEHDGRIRARARDAEDEARVRYEPVVDAEHCRAQISAAAQAAVPVLDA